MGMHPSMENEDLKLSVPVGLLQILLDSDDNDVGGKESEEEVVILLFIVIAKSIALLGGGELFLICNFKLHPNLVKLKVRVRFSCVSKLP
jgi:hypothetical protein